MIPEYDVHVHTIWSGHSHASATVTGLAARAEALGMKLLCFSEHVHGPESLPPLAHIRRSIAELQPSCRCRLVFGAEIDADPDRSDGSLITSPPPGVELVIGSIHFLPGTRLLPPWDPVPPGTDQETVFQRWRETIMGLAANRQVDVIGHPGALIFNAVEVTFFDRILAVMREAAHISAARGQAWDVNNLIFAKLKEPYRRDYRRVIRLAYEVGVPLLYGSDTHNLAALGGYRDIAALWQHLEQPPLCELLRLPGWLARRFQVAAATDGDATAIRGRK
ncbi:MAG: PHP domain-containing protein [Victivallales bacterium]|nr:PHP domain-containing protein [Victivallales bacterium]